MNLTYPGKKQFDVSKPENYWFFYWKTSPSLWEAKLQEVGSNSPLFIPLYWGLHVTEQKEIDFGKWKPETDLKRLLELCQKYQVRPILMLPVGPYPFLVGGGVPPYLSYKSAMNKDGTIMSFINESGEIHKVPSFFHMEILKEFQKFIYCLSDFLSEIKLPFEVISCECGTISEDGFFRSFFQDYSPGFQNSFNQFLKKNGMNPFTLNDKSLLQQKETEFRNLMFELYQEVIKENLKKSYIGKLKLSMLGTHSEQFFSRLFGKEDLLDSYVDQFFNSLNHEVLPSSLFIPRDFKADHLDNLFLKYINNTYLQTILKEGYFDEGDSGLTPLHFIEFVGVKAEHEAQASILSLWSLKEVIETTMGRCYQLRENVDFVIEEEEGSKFIFIEPTTLNKDNFNLVYKYFFQGMSVVLSEDHLDDELKKKFEIFILENNVKTEQLNILDVKVQFCELGEGSIFVISSKDIEKLNIQERFHFWQRVFATGKIQYLEVEAKEPIESFWFKRHPFGTELDYEHIRRITLVNPTGHKNKVVMSLKENFVFLKVIDQDEVKINQDTKSIKLDFAPRGKISLEFGYYE